MAKYCLAIIIVTFNSERYIGECISSIIKSLKKNTRYTITILDNNSADNTVSVVKKIIGHNPRISLVINGSNLGFSRAVNKGIVISDNANFYLLINPDTIIKDRGAIEKLIFCLKKNKGGICGGNTINQKGVKSGSYFRFPNLRVGIFDFTNFRKLCVNDKWHKYFYYHDKMTPQKTVFEVDVITGGFMLVKRNVFKKIGLLDEKFFMYLEDVDFCLRAKKAGVKILHTNNSSVIHIGGASSNNKDRIRHASWLMSRKKYYLKHFNFLINMIIQPIFILDDLLIISRHFLKK